MIGTRASRLIAVALAGSSLLAVSACGSDNKAVSAATTPPVANTVAVASTVAPTAAPTTVAAQSATTTAATTTPAASADATTPPASAGGKVNINDASIPELEAAFKAAGVTNSRRWAQEVDEYRPYPSDPQFAKLRQELGKYNIDPKILDLIIATLEF